MESLNILLIDNNKDYQLALKRYFQIYNAKIKTNEFMELKILSKEIKNYESSKKEYFILKIRNNILKTLDPIQYLKYYMYQNKLKTTDFIGIIGTYYTNVSEVFNYKQALNLKMIRNIHSLFNDVNLEIKISEYKLKNKKIKIDQTVQNII